MRFSAKGFALAALSVYYDYTEIIKTLSFDVSLLTVFYMYYYKIA